MFKKFRNMSILLKYIISYSGLILVASILLSLLLFMYTAKEVTQKNLEVAQNKIDLIAQDLNNQQEICSSVALSIQLRPYYNYSFISRNKYYEVEMLEDLVKFSGYSPIVQRYFLYYPQTDLVYNSTGKSCTVSTYFSSILGIKQWQGLWDDMLQSRQKSFYITDYDSNFLFFAYPIRNGVSYEYAPLLIFVIEKQTLLNRFTTLTAISQADFLLLTPNGQRIELLRNGERFDESVNHLSSNDGEYFSVLTYSNLVLNQYSYINFQKYFALIAISGVLLFLTMGIYLAYLNYKPIKLLKMRYFKSEQTLFKNELMSIEKLFDEKELEITNNQKEYSELLSNLKEQILSIVLQDTQDEQQYNKEWIYKTLHYIRDGKPEDAKLCITENVNALIIEQQFPILKRFIYSDVVISLVKLGGELKVSIPLELIENSLTAEHAEKFISNIHLIIDYFNQLLQEREISEFQTLCQKISSFVDENYCQYDMGLPLLSQQFHLSQSQISRICSKIFDHGFKEHIIILRMEKAKQLLLSTDYSVGNISELVGYSSTSHFIKLFKKYTQHSPREYRQSDD